jgi:hypothetical protein
MTIAGGHAPIFECEGVSIAFGGREIGRAHV